MEKVKSSFIKYVSTNVIGMIGLSCYILADTFFIAKALGTAGLASINFSISIFSIMQGIGLMIGIGGATDYSIRKQEHKDSSNTSFMHALFLGALSSLIFIVIAMFFTVPLSRLLGADATTLPLTKTYLTTVLSFSPFFILNNILLAFIRNDNNPKLSMIAMLVSSLANIILDYVFMFPFSMGMFGAAFATGLSPIISLGVLSTHFITKKHSFHLIRCKIQLVRTARILALGFSSFIGELASAISLITYNLIILGIEGNTGVAAYGIIANIALIATAVFVGIAQGLQPLASDYYSKGKLVSVNRVLRYAIITAILFSTVIYGSIAFFANPIVSVFNSENNSKLAMFAVEGAKLYFIGYIFAGINIVASAFLSATSNAMKAMMISTLRSCIVLVPAVLIFSSLFQMTGVWLSFVMTEFLVFLLTLISLKRRQD